MIDKKYWLDVKKQIEFKIKRQTDDLNEILGTHQQQHALLKLCDEKLSEFPVDDDPMPEELKEVAEELKKDA